MPWKNSRKLPFTRIEIAAHVPPVAGVFAVHDGRGYVFVGDAWNLRSQLLGLANVVSNVTILSVEFETCAEEEIEHRMRLLSEELTFRDPLPAPHHQ